MPPDAERPVIRAVNSDEESPIAWIIVHTQRDINEVRLEAEEVIQPRLERLEGVGAVWLFGGQEREVHVVLDDAAMAARGLSIAQVRDALRRENTNIKGGNIDMGAVQLGGMLLSTLFTLILVPVMLSPWVDARVALASLIRSKATTRHREENSALGLVRENVNAVQSE